MQTSIVILSKFWVNTWKKIWGICKKLDKMSIRDWGTVEKIQPKFKKKVLVLSNICWNFEKKSEKYSEKLQGNFKIIEKMFKNFGYIMNEFV